MQSLADMRREAALQRQRERERLTPRPSPAGSVAASEDLDAFSTTSRMSQFSKASSTLKSLKSEKSFQSFAGKSSESHAHCKNMDGGIDQYEKVGENLVLKSSATDAQAGYEPNEISGGLSAKDMKKVVEKFNVDSYA